MCVDLQPAERNTQLVAPLHSLYSRMENEVEPVDEIVFPPGDGVDLQ